MASPVPLSEAQGDIPMIRARFVSSGAPIFCLDWSDGEDVFSTNRAITAKRAIANNRQKSTISAAW